MSARASSFNVLPQTPDTSARQIKIVKQPNSAIIPDRKASLMKRIADMESELGRMMKLLSEMRADAAHLTVE